MKSPETLRKGTKAQERLKVYSLKITLQGGEFVPVGESVMLFEHGKLAVACFFQLIGKN